LAPSPHVVALCGSATREVSGKTIAVRSGNGASVIVTDITRHNDCSRRKHLLRDRRWKMVH
jgi:hypothetical protein